MLFLGKWPVIKGRYSSTMQGQKTDRSGWGTPLSNKVAALSIFLNVVLIAHFYNPTLWNDIMMAAIKPPTVKDTDHVLSSPDAPVTIIEYSDFQCPFCANFHTSMKKLVKDGDVKWIYRHFPVIYSHPLAEKAAEAAECAGDQEKFWDYADMVFEEQKNLRSEETLLKIGIRVGLNTEAFEECLSSEKYKEKVWAQLEEGRSLRVSATPTFFVDGKRYIGALPYEMLKTLIDNQTGKNQKTF